MTGWLGIHCSVGIKDASAVFINIVVWILAFLAVALFSLSYFGAAIVIQLAAFALVGFSSSWMIKRLQKAGKERYWKSGLIALGLAVVLLPLILSAALFAESFSNGSIDPLFALTIAFAAVSNLSLTLSEMLLMAGMVTLKFEEWEMTSDVSKSTRNEYAEERSAPLDGEIIIEEPRTDRGTADTNKIVEAGFGSYWDHLRSSRLESYDSSSTPSNSPTTSPSSTSKDVDVVIVKAQRPSEEMIELEDEEEEDEDLHAVDLYIHPAVQS